MFKRFSAGFAVGYVFGARAGQKRYEQMADLAEKVMDMPLVSRAAERAHDLATGENGRRLVDSLKERVPFTRAADEESDEGNGGNADEGGTGHDGGDSRREDEEEEDGSEGQISSNGSSRRRADRRQAAGRQGSGSRTSKGRVGSLASAALERGRVD